MIEMTTMNTETLDRIELAARMINNTRRHVFLTGKAGTGKTTFLHSLAKATHKNYLVVAPTGIAALNAGGVTIHSQFLLPFGSFIPGDNPQHQHAGAYYTRHDLSRRHPLNSLRKQVLRSIDLLIIDEVSMLRADLLDAIDSRLRSVKGNFRESFGGVQLLMIGDLYQLPPIVKDDEWRVLREHYRSPHFFEAQALRHGSYIYVELEKIFRQSDPRFIDLLNNLRNNCCTPQDLATLNAAYDPSPLPEEGVITLTTHNQQAEAINRKALDALPGRAQQFRASVEGDFPEHLYPIAETLEFKVGAQVMFVKNDTFEKKFYNGKIAKVTAMGDDSITVLPQDESRTLTLGMMVWENKRYTLNEATGELAEEVVGTFTQYPIKTAWAITVHKSQGLTFDKAVIDVGQAFAPGQVYVALSRLRSLEGLRLRTKINPSVISSDPEVVRFSSNGHSQPPLDEVLASGQREYLREALMSTFHFDAIAKQLQYAMQKMEGHLDFEDAEMNMALYGLSMKFKTEEDNTLRFRRQIDNLVTAGDFDQLRDRIEKGSQYYLKFLQESALYLMKHTGEVEMLSRTKTYLNLLAEIDQVIHHQLGAVLKAGHLTACIAGDRNVDRSPELDGKLRAMREATIENAKAYLAENPKNLVNKSGRKRKPKDPSTRAPKKAARPVGETYQITRELFEKGKSLEDIAKIRELTPGTIEGHFAKLVSKGDLKVEQVLPADTLTAITDLVQANPTAALGELFNLGNAQHSFARLRMVQAHLERESEVKEGDGNAQQD